MRTLTMAFALGLLALTATTARAQSLTWTDEPIGRTATARMSSAPFPHASRPQYRDDRVTLFVPADFRPGPSVDLVVHYHGHRTDITATDRSHRYREQLARSRKNAVLLLPQGPVRASDSAGGKHETAGGLSRFVAEALTLLAREGVVPQGARLGRLVLSGHSGGYQVIAKGITVGGVPVSEVYLHDGLYGELAAYQAFGEGSGRLVSTYTRTGGTAVHNGTLKTRLQAAGVTVSAREDDEGLATSRVSIVPTDQTHDEVTRGRWRFTRLLRTSGLSDLGVARADLLSVEALAGGKVRLRWAPARSALLSAWRVEAYDPAAGPGAASVFTVAKDRTSVDLTPPSPRHAFRVLAVDDRQRAGAPSDTYSASAGSGVVAATRRALVVDGFARTVGGGFAGTDAHAFAVRAGSSVTAAGWAHDTVDARAFASVDLSRYGAVIWLAGDQSAADSSLDRAERVALAGLVSRGGCLLLSGSEVGFDLAGPNAGPDERAFLNDTMRVTYTADTAAGKTTTGADLLANLTVRFGGAGGGYPVASPDVFTPRAGSRTALRYANGTTAATIWIGGAGAARSAAFLMGFPLECIDDASTRDALVAKVLNAFDAVNVSAGRSSGGGPNTGLVDLIPH